MRICLVGDYSQVLDEGFRNVAFYLAEEMAHHHQIMRLDMNRIFSLNFWIDVKKFDPQIVHYIPGRTLKSFIVLKALALCNNPKTIMSVLHPGFSSFSKKLIPLFKPDLILVQSSNTETMFSGLGCKIGFAPNGVDTEKFVPVSQGVKQRLRERYGIDKEKFVILHVGHLTSVRNLRIFNEIQGGDNQVIIVASSQEKFYLGGGRWLRVDQDLAGNLKEKGCIIWRHYFKNIEEIYALSDCYMFPVLKGYSLLSPLSVMEAMSCNLPVICTEFEGLSMNFEDGEGLYFAEKDEDFVRLLGEIKSSNTEVKTREKVLPYSWKEIIKKLEQIYDQVIKE